MFALPWWLLFLSCTTHAVVVVAFYTEPKYPCAFIDTVNISGTHALNLTTDTYLPLRTTESSAADNETVTEVHATATTYANDLVAVYDFVIRDGVRWAAEPHLRACACKQKPCIRFCCPPAQYYDTINRTCYTIVASFNVSDTNNNTSHNHTLNEREMFVMLVNGSERLVNTSVHFAVHVGTPCSRMRLVTKDNHIVHWTLYENGTIAHRNHLFSKHYCYTPLQPRNNSPWEWQPLACAPERLPFVLGVREWTYAISLIIAVICMCIILFVYLLCTDLRNTFYGVAIKAYTLCIIIAYSLLAHLTLTDPTHMSKFACTNIPCLVVLYLVLSFYILSFISFNFYLNFYGIILSKFMFWLIFCPIVLLAVGWSFFVGYQHYGNKPIFGIDNCWFDPRNWSIMIYLYAPICVAAAICGLFYILTFIRRSERRGSDINKTAIRIEENRYSSFWKFFGYTFGTWLICMISFAFNYYRGEYTHINYAVCLVMALHGFGSIYALLGKNRQIQNFLSRIEDEEEDEDDNEEEVDESVDIVHGHHANSMPMTNF